MNKDLFARGWLREHLAWVAAELASRPPEKRPKLTGDRGRSKREDQQ